MSVSYEVLELTREQAIEIYNTEWWKSATDEQIVSFELFTPRLCLPFDRLLEAIAKVLGRPVWSHEFASSNIDNLRREYLGDKPAPSFDDIVNLIPEEKRMVITPKQDGE